MGYHLHERKKLRANVPSQHGWSLAPEFNSLAWLDIQDDFALAVPAVNREALGFRLGIDPQKMLVPIAGRACNPSAFSYIQCNGLFCVLQGVSLLFLIVSVNIHKVSRIRNQ